MDDQPLVGAVPSGGTAASSLPAFPVISVAEVVRELARRDAILQAVAFAGEAFLRGSDFERSTPLVLQRLGEAARVSRVYVFESRWVRHRRLSSQRYEWVAPGVPPQIDDPALQNVPLRAVGFGRWEDVLSSGGAIEGRVLELPPVERDFFARCGILSVAAVPIFLDGEWWGYMGFDDCATERVWSPQSVAALRVAADLFGGMLARRELDERSRALIEATAEGIVVHDGAHVLDVNPSLLELLGYERDDVVGRNPFSFLDPPTRAAALSHTRREDATPYEGHIRRRDGSWLPASFRGKTSRYGHRQVRLVTIRDMTAWEVAEESERRRLQEHAARVEAEAAERRAEFLAEASRILISSFDTSTTLARFARLAVPFLGDYCLVDVLHGDTFSRVATAHADATREPLVKELERFPPGYAPNPIMRACRTGQTVLASAAELEPDVLAQDPEHRAILELLRPRTGIFAPMVGRDGIAGVVSFVSCDEARVYGADEVAFAEDLANRLALAIGNAQLFQHAQEATRERDEILAIVAHDLRNPLTGILGAAQLLQDGTAGADAPRFLDMILRSGERMNGLIEDLLEITRIGRGRLTLELRAVNVEALMTEAAMMLRPLAQARGLRLDTEEPGEPLRVRADAARVLQVLSNLLGNAIKFTPEGGAVLLRCRAVGEEARFDVVDTGPGIPPEQVPDVFGRFWQAKTGDRRGVGLGLSIAREIVASHGGRIWLESEPGRGSVFSFTLPLTENQRESLVT